MFKVWLRLICLPLIVCMQNTFSFESLHVEEARALELPWSWKQIGDFRNKGINVVEQISEEVILLGTANGLLRYDGREWHNFSEVAELHSQPIEAILKAVDGSIYVRTRHILFRLHGQKWSKIYQAETDRSQLLQTNDGSIWATDKTGILEIRGESVKVHTLDGLRFDDLSDDEQGNLWLVERGSGHLHRIPIRNSKLVLNDRQRVAYIGSNESSDLIHAYSIQHHDDCIWHISQLAQNPAYCYQVSQDKWQEVAISEGLRNTHYGVALDARNHLYIWGPFYIAIYDGERWDLITAPKFNVPRSPYKIETSGRNSFWVFSPYSPLWKIANEHRPWGRGYRGLKFQLEYPDNMFWFISQENKVVLQNKNTSQWVRFDSDDQLIDKAVTVQSRGDKRIWIAGSHEGVAAISYADVDELIERTFNNTASDSEHNSGTDALWVRRTFPDLGVNIDNHNFVLNDDGSALFGAHLAFKGGLVHYLPEALSNPEKIIRIPPPLAPSRITAIATDKNKNVWLSSGPIFYKHRLNDLGSTKIQRYENFMDLAVNSKITHILVDNKNNLWLATRFKNVYFYDGKTWLHHGENYGLHSRAIFDFVQLKDNTIMAVADDNIYRYDGKAWSISFPDISIFNLVGGDLGQDLAGDLWINIDHQNLAQAASKLVPLPKGLTSDVGFIYTHQYTFDSTAPETQILAFNRHIREGDYNIVHWNAVDNWEMSGEKNLQFSYRLNNTEWSAFAYQKSHIFENLKPASYRLSVRSRDVDFNIDASPATIEFKVIPVLWKQTWFQLSALLVLLLIVTFIYIVFRQRIKHALNIANIRSNFYTNISHELITPLTLILSPTDKLIESEMTEEQGRLVKTIKRNAERLLNLVEQLLDHRKIEAKVMRLKLHDGDIVQMTREQLEPFELLADSKKLNLHFRPSCQNALVKFDRDIYSKILSNLVLNAIKYTPDGGQINVILKLLENDKSSEQILNLIVEDTGPGVNKEEIEHIFQQFYRIGETKDKVKGSGIGLALCKELVELCKGEITVDSPLNLRTNEGSRFTVSMPLALTELGADSIETYEGVNKRSSSELEDDPLKAKILIVEDDIEIAEFIQHELNGQFNVSVAENGFDGLMLAERLMPDLIVTDLMMPILDGLQMCKRLKSNELISHIPIIILTAKGSEYAELQGLSIGADDYIAKPFQIAILRQRIENLILARKKWRESFDYDDQDKAIEDSPTKTDKDFLQRALKVIHEHIDDIEFGVNDFAEAMHMSYQNSYLKTKALTNMGPRDLIRYVRLEKSMQLIKASAEKPNITEVASQVGFDNYSYFSRVFKKKFGVSPSKVWEEK